ncbi:hypothetical protein SSX86_032191 [Deinandra increscens subsp. villosa]|uniref:Transferase, Chloramphenicol acetyltransferase-like domain protein n=1 Tax=Deinandra increscens subsp. villosa TaxID=3103831 RepID=A0AAP0C5D6_9ASTR
MLIMEKFLRFGRRQLHTIISREIIKPSSPTPSHLHTYHLSPLDLHAPHSYVPLILFYPNNKGNRSLTANEKAQELKKSLSQTLTRYYPFAGRINSPYNIDCNDEGVVFVEAENDSPLEKFQNMSEEDHTINQLFADGMVWEDQDCSHRTGLMGVQLNRFACGGIGLAVSISHRVGDGCTIGSYMTHWASVARYGSTHHKEVLPLNPRFIQSPPAITSLPLKSSDSNDQASCADYVTRKFVFPNNKLNELKNKVEVNNPTRVEILCSLIYKTAVEAAGSGKPGSFKPSFLVIPVDVRKNFNPKLPETTVGNFISLMLVTTRQESEISLSKVVSEIKKEKMELNRVQSMQQAVENVESFMSRLGDEDLENVAKRSIWCSSLCGFPYNKVDFGWGKATGATVILGSSNRTGFMLMDTPDGSGIQARVVLGKENMEMFENDKELLSFCQI